MTHRQDRVIAQLQATLPPGSRIYTAITSAARSGMSRMVAVYTVEWRLQEPIIRNIGLQVGAALGWHTDDAGNVKVMGTGFDAGLHLAACLSVELGYSAPATCLQHERL